MNALENPVEQQQAQIEAPVPAHLRTSDLPLRAGDY
jgi:hypothetical protein